MNNGLNEAIWCLSTTYATYIYGMERRSHASAGIHAHTAHESAMFASGQALHKYKCQMTVGHIMLH